MVSEATVEPNVNPAVITSRTIPLLSIACGVFVAYSIIKAALLEDGLRNLSLTLGAIAAVVGLWWLWRSRSTSVVVERDQFTINRGRRSKHYNRGDVVAVDLSGVERHISFADGTGVKLPLEGRDLVEAGLRLSPAKKRSRR